MADRVPPPTTASILTMSGSPDQAVPLADRVERLETHASFAEHTTDQLSDEIAQLNKRLHSLTTRMDLLEERLRRMLSPPDAPPDAD